MTTDLQFYWLLFLFTLLFFMQLWAIVKILKMLRQVLELYDKLAATPPNARRPETQVSTFRHTCQVCRHRQTFLDTSGKNVFVYHCALSRQTIQLDYSCEKFEFDAHVANK